MRDDEEDSIYDFWNKLPGPGEFSSDVFAAIPMTATVWEGVKIGVSEYLGVRWVVEVVDKDNVVVRRTDQPLAYRLKQTFRTPGGELNYAMWTRRDIPEDMGFTYMVGSGCFQKAIQRDLGIPVGVSANRRTEDRREPRRAADRPTRRTRRSLVHLVHPSAAMGRGKHRGESEAVGGASRARE